MSFVRAMGNLSFRSFTVRPGCQTLSNALATSIKSAGACLLLKVCCFDRF